MYSIFSIALWDKKNQMTISKNTDDEKRLIQIISNHQPIMLRLKELQKIAPHAYFAAGIIRNTVWSFLHEKEFDISGTEIDVIFYDEHDLDRKIEQNLQQKLVENFPDNEWDIINQAFVHTWYKTESGEAIAPLQSIAHALSLWPETATAIAVRLDQDDHFEIIAPFGLVDLFQLKLRWNKTMVSHAAFENRCQSKRFLQRFPKLNIIDN